MRAMDRLPARLVAATLASTMVLAACTSATDSVAEQQPSDLEPPHISVVAEGLINPLGLALHADGTVLIAEEGTGEGDDSAGVSVLTPDGRLGRVVSGLPSSRDSGDLSGVPLVGVSPNGETVYLAHFGAGALLTFPVPPEGLEPETKAQPALGPNDLGTAMVALNEVRLINPFDITFDEAARPVVSDASENGVAVETDDGNARFIHRFAELTDPNSESLRIDAVPTGITRIGDEYFVTLTGGCPYPAGVGRLVAIDDSRNERLIVDGLSMPIDVEVGADQTVWLLEFARFDDGASCFTGEGYLPGSGRLSRVLDDGTVDTVVEGLDFPGAVLPMPDGSLYITEVFSGRLLHASWTQDDDASAEAPDDSVWMLRDVAVESGLDFTHGAFQQGITMDPAAMMGGGLCWVDYDDDGWMDLYLVNSHATAERQALEQAGALPTNRLYRNEKGSFVDVSAGSGADLVMRGNGCVAGDLDGDGRSDLFVTADGPNALLLNAGSGTFQEVAHSAGVDAPEWNTAAVVGDVNGDGLPDLFVGSYIDLDRMIDKPSGAFPQDFVGLPDRLYINRGGVGAALRFDEVTMDAGLLLRERALGALLTDVDGDRDLDLYIANDGNPNRLYENISMDGRARFVDVTDEAGVGDSGSGMGIAGGDFDLDGAFDLIVTNWDTELNALYRNMSAGEAIEFEYMTYSIGMVGLGNNKTAWGATWADLDLDTDLDLLVVHGHVPISDPDVDAQLVRLYGNRSAEGDAGQLRDWTTAVGLDHVGPVMARGSAVADYDNDGDLDAAVNVIGGRALLLRNDRPTGGSVTVVVPGFHPGTVVEATLPDGIVLRREWHAGSSYLAGEDPRFVLGLGDSDRVDVLVRLPGGAEAFRSRLPVGSTWIVDL